MAIQGKYSQGMLDPRNRALYRSLFVALRTRAKALGFKGTFGEMSRVSAAQGIPLTEAYYYGLFKGTFYGMLGLDAITALARGYGIEYSELFSTSICEGVERELESPTTSLKDV